MVNNDLVGGAITILKNDGVSQWEGWQHIYEMENKNHGPNHQPAKWWCSWDCNHQKCWHLGVLTIRDCAIVLWHSKMVIYIMEISCEQWEYHGKVRDT